MTTDLNRAWSRRALASPPLWGRSLPDIWKDTLVTFSRSTPTDDGYGGFTHGAPLAYLTVQAPVYRTAEEGPFNLTAGLMKRVVVKVLLDLEDIPNPDDVPLAGLIPDKGDTMTYVDSLGETFNVLVDRVQNPGELADHLEITCLEFN